MTCPSREDLVAVLDGDVAPAALAEARRHLDGCGACRAELARLEAGVALLRAGSPAPEPSPWFATRLAARVAALPPPRRRLAFLRAVPWRLVGAGGLAAAVALGVVLVRHERTAHELAIADRLELLEDYEVVASLGDVESADDAEVVAALD
ncbi:MAG TPA: zf-HC2 domain-containing protein, partial [Anaeromyxobacter sp.]